MRRGPGPLARGSLFYFGHFASLGLYAPFINVYFVQLGLSGRQIGSLAALGPLLTLALAPPLAALADRRRWRVGLLVLASIGAALALFLLGLAHTFAWLALLMAAQAVCRSPVIPLADGMVARMAARHGLNYGSMRLWGSVAFASFAILGGAIWQQTGYGPMFAGAAVLFLPVALFAGMLEEGEPPDEARRQPLGSLARDRGLLLILLATFLVSISLGLSIFFEGVYMSELGGSELLIGALPGVAAFSELPTMHFSGRLGRRWPGPKVLWLAYGLLALTFLGYSLARAPWMLLLFAVGKGLGFGLFFTSTVRLVDERVPGEWSATAQSLLNATSLGLAFFLAGPLGGELFDLWGAAAVFAAGTGAVLLALGVLLAARVRRNRAF